MNRRSSTGGVDAPTMVAPAGAPTPLPAPPRSPATVGSVSVSPALPGGPASSVPNLLGAAASAVPNLLGAAIEHRDEERRRYVAAAKIRFRLRLKARRSSTLLRLWTSMARRLVKADHRSAAIVMSRGPAYVPPTPGSFPHRTPGGPVAAHGDTVTPEHTAVSRRSLMPCRRKGMPCRREGRTSPT